MGLNTVMFLFVFSALCCMCGIHSMNVLERAKEGYPVGYLSDCPGSERPVRIPHKAWKNLLIIAHGKTKKGLFRKKYDYFNAVKGITSNPNFDFKKKTLVFASGYLDSTDFPVAWTIAMFYINLDYNVLVLDTQKFTTHIYPIAARLMRPVGKRVGQILAELSERGLDISRTEMLGLSLGGQTISYIAKGFREITGRNFSRLTALDPSGPCFRHLPATDRLDASDADFVDVLLSNIDGYGMATPTGHVNYYINGGEYQPGDVPWIPCGDLCSHIRSFTLWLSALMHPDKCVAMKCDSVQQARDSRCYERQPVETSTLGLNPNKTDRGIFYLTTNYAFPYCLGPKGLLPENQVWRRNLLNYNNFDTIEL